MWYSITQTTSLFAIPRSFMQTAQGLPDPNQFLVLAPLPFSAAAPLPMIAMELSAPPSPVVNQPIASPPKTVVPPKQDKPKVKPKPKPKPSERMVKQVEERKTVEQ